MELLKLLIIVGTFIYLPIWSFFEFIVILFFLNKIYKIDNISYLSSSDPMNVVIGCINMILHVMVYDLKLLVGFLENTKLIKCYNYLNNKYLTWRVSMFFKLMSFTMSKYYRILMSSTNKLVPTIVSNNKPILSLKTDIEMTSFLDDLLVTKTH